MSEVLDRICRTKEQAHQAASQGYAHAQAILANGRPVRMLVEEQEDEFRRRVHDAIGGNK